MNRVVLMGRLTRNPDVRYSQGAEPMCIARFSLAVDRRFKKDGEQNADFISCIAFGKTGQFLEKYCQQGTKLVVEGRIQTGSYQKQDGTTVYTTDVVVESVEFAESKNASQPQNNAPQYQPQMQPQNNAPQFQPQYQQQTFQQNAYRSPVEQFRQPNADGFMDIPDAVDDEGLPFN